MSTIHSDTFRYQPILNTPIDPFRPMQFMETVKDAFVLELRKFFSLMEEKGLLETEIPTIEKFRVADETQDQQPFLQQANIIRQFPDVLQKLPIIAITTALGRSRKLGVGSQYTAVVQDAPRLVTNQGPWNIPPNALLSFQTAKGATAFVFTPVYFPNGMTNVTPLQLAAAINTQSNRIFAYPNQDGSVTVELKSPKLQFIKVLQPQPANFAGTIGDTSIGYGYISAQGQGLNGVTLTGVTVDGTSIFGFTYGQMDNIGNPLRPPMHRYQVCKEITVNIDIGSDSDNGRTEVCDLVSYYFDLRLQERDFMISGDTSKNQNFQIILKWELGWSSEFEIPRPEGDGEDKIYGIRLTVPVTMVDYVDRPATQAKTPVLSPELNAVADTGADSPT